MPVYTQACAASMQAVRHSTSAPPGKHASTANARSAVYCRKSTPRAPRVARAYFHVRLRVHFGLLAGVHYNIKRLLWLVEFHHGRAVIGDGHGYFFGLRRHNGRVHLGQLDGSILHRQTRGRGQPKVLEECLAPFDSLEHRYDQLWHLYASVVERQFSGPRVLIIVADRCTGCKISQGCAENSGGGDMRWPFKLQL